MSEEDNEFIGLQQKPKKTQQPKPTGQTTNIKVIVKVRPLLPTEASQQQCVSVNQNTIQVRDLPNIQKQAVDKAFNGQSTQKQLFTYLVPTIEKMCQGFNVTLFSYGQTGSGKTYTMFGSDWDNLVQQQSTNKRQQTFLGNVESDQNFAGLIPRCIHHLFSHMYLGKSATVNIFCSFLQLYNQRLIDLLDSVDRQLIIHENKTDGIYVEGLCQVKVTTFEQCINLMRKGERNRTVRQTSMNVKSSRSHSIFQFVVEEVFPDRSYRRTKLNLCDLAGSEKINKAEELQMTHFKELKNINLSLTTLGKVIWSLSARDSPVPPFRESKLTRLLQDSLGGNTHTTIIANITTKYSCIQQTLNTLKFVQRARQVKTEVFVKNYQDKPQLQEMQKEIIYLRSVLKMKRMPAEQIDLAQRVKQLENENKRLKKIAEERNDVRLRDENIQMKIQLEKLSIDRIHLMSPPSHSPITSANNTLATHQTIDETTEHRKMLTSQTIDKHSTHSSHLPQLQSRYSNHSGRKQPELQRLTSSTNGSINQNIILRRLDMIERMKAENKDRLQKKLRELDKGNKTAIERTGYRDLSGAGKELGGSRAMEQRRRL